MPTARINIFYFSDIFLLTCKKPRNFLFKNIFSWRAPRRITNYWRTTARYWVYNAIREIRENPGHTVRTVIHTVHVSRILHAIVIITFTFASFPRYLIHELSNPGPSSGYLCYFPTGRFIQKVQLNPANTAPFERRILHFVQLSRASLTRITINTLYFRSSWTRLNYERIVTFARVTVVYEKFRMATAQCGTEMSLEKGNRGASIKTGNLNDKPILAHREVKLWLTLKLLGEPQDPSIIPNVPFS